MNRILAATAAVFFFTSTSYAADMVADADLAPVAPIEADFFDWSGAYVGGHLGYGWSKWQDDMPPMAGNKPPLGLPDEVEDKSGTFLGGIHAGYNWQNGSFVYGVEGDLDYQELRRGRFFRTQPDGSISNAQGSLFMESDWQASLRLRAGYAIDTWLFYGTGGAAFARGELSTTRNPLGPSPAAVISSDSNTHIGWTAGAGIEKAFTTNWIGRLEARYTDFGSQTYDLGQFGENIKSRWDQTAVTVGLQVLIFRRSRPVRGLFLATALIGAFGISKPIPALANGCKDRCPDKLNWCHFTAKSGTFGTRTR